MSTKSQQVLWHTSHAVADLTALLEEDMGRPFFEASLPAARAVVEEPILRCIESAAVPPHVLALVLLVGAKTILGIMEEESDIGDLPRSCHVLRALETEPVLGCAHVVKRSLDEWNVECANCGKLFPVVKR